MQPSYDVLGRFLIVIGAAIALVGVLLTFARGLRLGLLGLAAGIGLALILGRLLQTLLYGVKPVAPAVYAATALALLLIALLACVIPAQRAARVDPVVALRDE